jgi:cell division transport system permease protein
MKLTKTKPNSTGTILLISLTSMCLIIAFFIQLLSGLNAISKDLSSQLKIYVYIEDGLKDFENNRLIKSLNSLNFIDKDNNGKLLMEYTSKEEIAKEFLQSTKEDYKSLLGDENPFRDMYTISIPSEKQSDSLYRVYSKILEEIPGVYEVTYPNNYLSLLTDKSSSLTYIVIFISAVLLSLIYLQISNYIKFVMENNKLILKSMQLLGSTDWFIKKPYLGKMFKNSLFSSGISVVLLLGLYYYLSNTYPDISGFLLSQSNLFMVFVYSTIITVSFTLIATLFSLNRYLNIHHNNLF